MPSDFLNDIFKKINNNPDKTALYREALVILLRHKVCAKEFLETLLQVQTTQSRASETLQILEEMHALLCDAVKHNKNIDFGKGVNFCGLINDALDDAGECFGACFKLTKPIRDFLEGREIEIQWTTKSLNSVIRNSSELLKEQERILVAALEMTIKLFKDLKMLFAANATHAIARYATQNVSIICPEDMARSGFTMACAVDELKMRVDPQMVQQVRHEFTDTRAQDMFKYVFINITNHAEEFYSEFIRITDLLIARDRYAATQSISYYPTIAAQYVHVDGGTQSVTFTASSSPSATSSDSGIVVPEDTINEAQLCETPNNNKSYASIVKKPLPEIGHSPKFTGDTSKIKDCADGSRKIQRKPRSKAQKVEFFDNSLNLTKDIHKIKDPSASSRKKQPKARPESSQPIDTAERSVKQTVEKTHKPKERKFSFADFAPFVQNKEEPTEERPVSPKNKKGEKTAQNEQQKKNNKKNPTDCQKAQEKTDDDFLDEAIKEVAEERARLAADGQLLKDSEKFVAKHLREIKGGSRVLVKPENIVLFLNSASELRNGLALLLQRESDKKNRKKICDLKGKIKYIDDTIQELVIPKNIEKSIKEITEHGLNTSIVTFVNFNKLIKGLDEADLLERYLEQYGSSRMRGFLNMLTKLTKGYFFAGDEMLDMASTRELMQAISDRILYLTIISNLRKALYDDVLFRPNRAGSLETMKLIEKCLEKIKVSEDSKILLLRNFVESSSGQKIFYIALRYKRFELAKLLANTFAPTADDLYIAHLNGAWSVIRFLLEKGADPFSLYKGGQMAFKNIVDSGVNKNIIFSINLIEKRYDQLNTSHKLPTIIDILFCLPIKQDENNSEIRNVVKCLLKKKPELTEMPSKTGGKIGENSIFKPLLYEIKMAEEARRRFANTYRFYQRRNHHNQASASDLTDEQHVIGRRLETSL